MRLRTLILVVAIASIIGALSGYAVIKLAFQPSEEERPVETISGINVLKWNRPVESLRVETSKGPMEIPVKGKVNVVVPQYVNCPDICHLESLMMKYAMKKAIEEGLEDEVVWVTIDVDPWNGSMEAAVNYMESIAGELLGEIEWIWVLDDLDNMRRVYDAYTMAVERDNETGLVTHTALFYIVDRNGVLVYIVQPNWDDIAGTGAVLWSKIKEVIQRD
ncbi:MAG: SCO family protein [Desulfurococcales archaeon]|nr:SCO family protein [Desulfurococcales archaeon]